MATRLTTARYHKILFGVILIAFGLVALAVLYKAASLSTEGRSKAAQTEKVYKQWTFNKGNDTLGWEGVGAALSAGNGKLKVLAEILGNKYMAYKFAEPLLLPIGTKTVKINISLQPIKARPMPIGGATEEPAQQETVMKDACITAEGQDRPEWCPPSLQSTPTPTPTCKARPACLDNPPYCRIPVTDDMCPPKPKTTPEPKPNPKPATAVYTFGLTYATSTGAPPKAAPFTVSADGKKQLVSVSISEIGEIKLTELRIGFGDSPVDAQILIDEIRLVGSKGKEQACETAPPGCLTIRPDGSVIICDPPPGVTYCKPTPTEVVSTCKPVSCAVPPKGCYWDNPAGGQGGCPISCGTLQCPNASGPANVSGTFTKEATDENIQQVADIANEFGLKVPIIQSDPPRFGIKAPSMEICTKIRNKLSALDFIERISDCRPQTSVTNLDATVSN